MTAHSIIQPQDYQLAHREAGASCACFAVRKASRLITQLYDYHLAAAGIKTTQFTLLSSIATHDGASMNALANMLGMDRTTLTRNLKPLIARKWVTQRASTEDKRVKLFGLTPAGHKLANLALPMWRAAHEDFLAQVSESRWDRLSSDLRATQRAISGKRA